MYRHIALDDLSRTNGACAGELSCDFEADFCGFYNIKQGDDFDWQRGKGKNYMPLKPQVDHTLQNTIGYYVYIKQEIPSLATPLPKGINISLFFSKLLLVFEIH